MMLLLKSRKLPRFEVTGTYIEEETHSEGRLPLAKSMPLGLF